MSKHQATFTIERPISLAEAAPSLAREGRDRRVPKLELVASEGRILKTMIAPPSAGATGFGESEIHLALMDYAAMAFVFMSVASGPALVWLLLWMAA